MSAPQTSVKVIFLHALELITDTDRQAYLDTQCGSDAKLREEVDELLRHHDDVGGFLESPPAAVVESVEKLRTSAPPTPALSFLRPSSRADSLGRLAHYEILEVVGSGGMGIVLKAFDERLQRVVAIKAMSPALAASGTGRQRFVREAQAAAAVNHDNVVDIYAVEDAGPVPYLVMEYIAGISLDDRLKQEGAFALKEILRISLQTADGLAAAHRQGLVHRDVKPANILLENGVERVKITDFGLARAADDASVTQTGAIAGTPAYMSPEQARGEVVDHRSDLFSLGSVLYMMCVGQTAFRSSTSLGMLKQVCEEEPHPIHDLNPDIPEWLCAIVEKLHAKLPAERFQSAAELAETLGAHLAHVQQPSLPLPIAIGPVAAPQKPRVTNNTSSSRNHRRRWAIAAVAALVVMGVTLSLTDASGITHVAATVIRILTPEGTLVVEVDDPGVKVTVEGDGGLIITGAGPQEVRLRPGSYKVRATKDGKSIRDEELITITRGDKRVVKVTHEAASTPATPTTAKPSEQPFVVLGGKGVAERKFDTLAEAVLTASDGDTIEVRGNGPFVLNHIEIPSSLVIRAGPESRPVFKPEIAQNINVLSTRAPLVLEGIEFHWVVTNHENWSPALINATSSSYVAAAHCRMVVTGMARLIRANIILGGEHCEVRNCEFLHRANHAVAWRVRPNGKVIVDGCSIAGTGLSVDVGVGGAPTGSGSVHFTRNSVVGVPINLLRWSTAEAAESPIALQAADNVVSSQRYMVLLDRPGITELSPSAVHEVVKRLLSYQERHNVYDVGNGLLGYGWQSSFDGPKDLETWQKFWGLGPTESLMGPVRFQGGNLDTKRLTAPDQLTPDDFRLRPDSAGYRAGPDGKDLGADIDLVGPGPAYERWKKTPEYQQWLKDTGQKKESGDRTQ